MIPFKQLLILVAFFLFFIACGDEREIEAEKKSNENTEKTKIEERFTNVTLDKKKDTKVTEKILSKRKIMTRKLIQSKGILGGTSGGFHSMGSGIGSGIGSGSSYANHSVNTYSNTEKYSKINENKLKSVKKEPLSTFSIDVDTASYSLVKSMIRNGGVNSDAVRAEEFINYFIYDYPQPKDENTPFSVITEVGPSILNKDRSIIHIGIQGRKKADEKRKSANLVFLIDTSGSMSDYNKLPLLKKSLNILINNLTKKDIITIVTYAGDSFVALKPTSGANKIKIREAIDKLMVYGGTNGEGGIRVAYSEAMKKFDKNKINRIILCTDGDFNIGVSSVGELQKLVKEKRKTGISLSTIGFGRGNYNDAIMEKLADNGNGNYFYINDLNEAKKVFSKELTSNLEIIAKDVKIQVEFNKKYISYYRLIGYENRVLNKEDFNNDKVDAGEIGSGHTVTALYEVTFTNNKKQPVDKLRYEDNLDNNEKTDNKISEIAYVKLRYKKPNGEKSILINHLILEEDIIKNLEKTSNNFRFSSAVAAFALKLKNSDNISISNKKLFEIAKNSKGSDEFGYRKEFIGFVNELDSIKANNNDIGIRGGEPDDDIRLSSGVTGASKYNPYSRSHRRKRVNISDKIIKVTGELTESQIKKVVRIRIAQIRYCYEKEVIRNPNLKGSINLKWVINSQGRVVVVKVKRASLKNKRIQNCVKHRIIRWRFPKYKKNNYTTVKYLFKFKVK